MAAWDTAQLPPAPSLVVPKMDFSTLGELGNAYYTGQQQQQQQALRTALKDPSLYDEKGNIDATKAANKLFQLGGFDQARSVATTAEFLKGAPPQQPGPWSIAAGGFLQPGQPPAVPPQGGSGMQSQPVTGPQAAAGPVRDPNLSPEEQITPSQVVAANQPRPAGPAASAQAAAPAPVPQPAQAAPEPAAVDTSAADSQVPKPFRDAGWSADRYRTMLHATAEQLRQQAAGMEWSNARGGIRQDSKPVLERAASLDAQAANIDKLLAPTTAARDVTTNVAGRKIGQEEEAKRGGALYNGIQGAARAFDEMRPHLDAMSAIFKDPNFYSGTGSQINLAYKRALVALGGDPNAALPQEAIKKVLAQNILNQVNQLKSEAGAMGQGGGRIFQSQIRLMEDAAQKSDNSPAALRYLTELGYRTGKHIQEVQDLAERYNGGRLDNRFNPILAKYNREHPMFTEAEMKDIRLVAPPEFNNPAQVAASGLPKGSPFKLPDGRIKYVP